MRPAFGGLDREELFRQITLEEPRPLRRFNPAVPADLETIILKAMSKEPIERYATARELADDLRRFRELKPIKAHRPTLWDRALKGARRHVAVVAAACLALLVTVGGLATGLLLIGHERDLASAKRKEALASAIEAQERAVDLNRQLYINRVNRAFGEWRENNVALAASLLEECPREPPRVGVVLLLAALPPGSLDAAPRWPADPVSGVFPRRSTADCGVQGTQPRRRGAQ